MDFAGFIAACILLSPVALLVLAVSVALAGTSGGGKTPLPSVLLAVMLACMLLTACGNKTETTAQRTRYTSEFPFAKTNCVQSDWRITK